MFRKDLPRNHIVTNEDIRRLGLGTGLTESL